MKAEDIIDKVDELKPNQYTSNTKIEWLNQLDLNIWEEIMMEHEDAPLETFDPYAEGDERELLLGRANEDVYRFYLEMQIDLANAEYGKYNNSLMLFNNAYSSFAKAYNRKHMPKQKVKKISYRW